MKPRVESVDALRGLIMVVMALDHTRDFFGMPGDNPTDLSRASAALFLTRWVTHFCAPVFFLLVGTGARLRLGKESTASLSRFLVTRGLWLVVLELTVLRCLVYQFNFDYEMTMLVVIWALGASMIVLAALVWLPPALVTAFGLLLIVGHNSFDSIDSDNPLWHLLHEPGFLLNQPGHVVFVAYTLVPWIGVSAVGYGLGAVYAWQAPRRRSFLIRVGLAAAVGFSALRWWNAYGDPRPWEHQRSALMTALSLLNTSKYPPSLCFLLMTLGPALIVLGATDERVPSLLRPALLFGRVPLFYYVVHFFLIHSLAVLACLARTGSAHGMFESPDIAHYPFSAPAGWGFPLPVVYAVWAFVVIAVYPACRWFAGVKAKRKDAWLSYV